VPALRPDQHHGAADVDRRCEEWLATRSLAPRAGSNPELVLVGEDGPAVAAQAPNS
jgi:hypothetical protein